MVKISSFFVAFPENMNFTYLGYLQKVVFYRNIEIWKLEIETLSILEVVNYIFSKGQ